MIIGLSILGALLSVILLIYNARKNPSAIYLGLFFLLISLYGLIQYIVLYSQSVVWVAIVFANAGFPTYLMGPVLYLYVRSLLNDDPRLRKTDLLHLLPMLVYLALIFPYLITPWSFKLEVARHFVEKTSGIGSFNFNIASIYQYIPVSVVYLSRPVLITGYLIASVYLLLKFSLSGSSSPLFSQQRFIRKWLWILLGFILVLSVSHGLQVAITTFERDISVFNTVNVLQVFSALGITGLLITPFFFPQIIYGLPRIPEPSLSPTMAIQDTENAPVQEKRTVARFEAEYINMIEARSEQCMTDYHPYLQPEFNLVQLSVMINIPAHHLAWYFREVQQKSFTDYRNTWRIRHAKSLIDEGKTQEMTLEAIGILSGFNSRNTFINAFKKFDGRTPGGYMDGLKS